MEKGGLGRKRGKDLLILALGLDFSKQEKLIDGGFTRDPLGTAESAMLCGLQSAIPAHSAAHVWLNLNLIYFSGKLDFAFRLAYSGIICTCKHTADEQRERLSLLKCIIRKYYSSCFDLLYPGIQPSVQALLCVFIVA